VSDTPEISKCPKCGGGRTHAEGGVSYGHCSSSWGPAWDRGELTVYNQGSGCRIRQLERELAEASNRITQLMEAGVAKDFEIHAHKASLEKCEKALNKIVELCEYTPERALMRPSWIREALDSIKQLKDKK